MIVDIFAAFLIICLLILFAAICAWSITYWFVSVPLLIMGLIWGYKREQKRLSKITPEENARAERQLARISKI